MATLLKQEDVGFSYNESEKRFTRKMMVEGTSMMEIFTSNILPMKGSRHPNNSGLRLVNCDCQPSGNMNGKIQAIATLEYSSVSEDSDKDPWDLGAQNVTVSYNTESAPFISGYNEEGVKIQNLNSAGCRILAETTRYIKTLSFMFCVKGKSSGEAPTNDEPVINKSTTKVAGYSIKKGTGLLMPMGASFIVEYEADGQKIKRQYWEIQATIQCNPNGWAKKELDVGTMALFPEELAEGEKLVAKPIYQFTPWESKESSVNMRVKPKFGSIDAVIAAKIAYAKLFSSSEYQRRFDELPYQEITEPLPLLNGQIYQDAIQDPVTYPYKTIDIYETLPASWREWDLPKKRK